MLTRLSTSAGSRGLLLVWLCIATGGVESFGYHHQHHPSSRPSVSFASTWTQQPQPSQTTSTTTTQLFALFEEKDDAAEEEEISKLIGKRSQIKRTVQEDMFEDEEDEEDGASTADLIIEDSNESSPLSADEQEAFLDFDLEAMPDFQTKRVKRSSAKKDAKQAEADKKKEATDKEATFVDFFSDYDDENELHIPNRIGISTRRWGEVTAGFVATSKKLKKRQLREGKFVPGDIQMAYNELMNEGVLLFDTSPVYGAAMAGKALSGEDILARCVKEYDDTDVSPILVGTYPNQLWQRLAGGLTNALSASCDKMELSVLDVYQIQSLGWLPSGGLVKGMNEAVIDSGTVNYAGLQNVSPIRLRRMVSKFDDLNIQVATNTFDMSLTNRKKEKWIQACKTMGVIPLVTNPLDNGLASGQFTASNPSGGMAGMANRFSFQTLEKLQPLHSVLETVSEKVKTRMLKEKRDLKDRFRGRGGPEPKINTDPTTTQIALNYIVAKGAVPLVEVNNPQQAQDVLGCLGWSLNDSEMTILEAAADLCK